MAREPIKGEQYADAIIDKGNRLGGLTIRAKFAESAMIGMIANPDISKAAADRGMNQADIRKSFAESAVKMADELIEALNKED